MTPETTDPITQEQLAALLADTGQHHHQAYLDSDGIDPEWALWYAGYLQAHMWDRAGTLPTRSQLTHLLLLGEAELTKSGADTPWPQYYAEVILSALRPN